MRLLLARTRLTTTQVTYRAGFGFRRNLFRVFRRKYGETPRRIAAKIRNGSDADEVLGVLPI